jgi:molecular chaperone HtpG
MSQKTIIDFLSEPTEELLRKQIKNIKESYTHPWDVLAELLQNSVDAIRRYMKNFPQSKKDHIIEIQIDGRNTTIDIKDSGVGFPIDDIKILLSPHGTDKKRTSEEIGYKGIGLKFAIFSSDEFVLRSRSVDGQIEGTIKGACTWVERGIGSAPKFEASVFKREKSDPINTYTHITLKNVENPDGENIFQMSTNRLVHLLRTKTAIGNTREIFKQPSVSIKVTLVHYDLDGKKHEVDIPFKYQAPLEMIEEKDLRDLGVFIEKAAAMDDRQKARELQDKMLYKIGDVKRAGRTIRYLACFASSRSTWVDISKRIDPQIGTTDSSQENVELLVSGGIQLATRGMPVGISIVPPMTGAAGYWPNMFILLEDDSLELDLGRKSIPGRTQGLLKEIAKDLFNEFVKYSQYIAGGPKTRVGPAAIYEQEKRNIFKELEKLTDLGLKSIKYLKYPDNQEAAVLAIFHELVGAEILHGYYALKQGYKSTYDFWGKYKIEPTKIGAKARQSLKSQIDIDIVIEFKHNGEDILHDVLSNRKFFEDIDLIICWDLDERKFAKENVNVRVLPPDEVFFYGSNYVLEWPGAYNLGMRAVKPVLALKRFIENIVATHSS